jgi:hypothetical protein
MAAVTGTVLAVGMGAYTIAQNEKAKKEAEKKLNNYERQDLENAFENIQISTMGSDLAREEAAGNAATMIDTLQRGGTRAVLGGLPQVQEYLTGVNNQAAQYLDSQQTRRDYAIAQEEGRIRDIRENRDMQNIGALSSQINAADQNIQNGYMGMASAAMYGARNIDFGGFTPQVEEVGGELKPITQPVSAPKQEIKGAMMPANYSSINPYGNNQAMTGDIWGQDPYGPEFYNKYFVV